jgi:type IV secretion system T-DNA border endonuclease VirD2
MTETSERPQAIIRIVPGGGARTVTQIYNQWTYLSRKGEMQLQRSERHLGAMLPTAQHKALAASWAVQTGSYQLGQSEEDSVQELTTHIVVSFPPTTELVAAFAAGRAWAEEIFGSGRNGGTFDYLSVCHSDRPHPHVHLIVNRRAFEGHWLKISRRHAFLNYDRLRSVLVDIACRHHIVLEATSRAQRGLADRPITYAEYRRRARQAIAISAAGPGPAAEPPNPIS